MLKTWTGIFALIAALAACAPMQPAGNPQNVRIESTPGMAVIYLMRGNPDWSYVPSQVYVGDRLIGTTHAGTYYRIELPPGRHTIRGFGVDGGTITLDTQAGGVYFVQQRVAGTWRSPTSYSSAYTIIDEARARAVMANAARLG
jgi:hypothetical protein